MSSPTTRELDEGEREAIEATLPEGESLDEVLQDVEAALNAIAGLEVDLDEPADLERVRRTLPTEPARARFIQAALPGPLHDALQYVSASDRMRAHWRRRRDWSTPSELPEAELRKRIAFGEAAREQRGARGTVPTEDGREIAASAANLPAEFHERYEPESSEPDDTSKGLSILRRILDRV